MIKYTALALLVSCSSTFANGVYVGAISRHLRRGDYTNETHELLIFEHENYLLGWFINSFDDDTFIAARRFNFSYSDIDFGVMIGASYGYDCDKVIMCSDDFTPLFSPYIAYSKYKIQPTVAIVADAVFFTVKFNY